jgi:hypothetical protein
MTPFAKKSVITQPKAFFLAQGRGLSFFAG